MKVMIGTPSAGMVHAIYAASLTAMVVHYLESPIFADEGPNDKRDVLLQFMVGSSISDNREKLVESALSNDCTHLLFVDDDMGFEPECLNIALGKQQPIILANYRMKSPPYPFLSRNPENTGQILTTDRSAGLQPCSFGGFGFALIERRVFEAVEKPRFLVTYSKELGTYSTEDKPFFDAAVKAGFQPYVDHEVSKRVWHNGNFEYRYKGN